jgi:hypothetical protein
MEETYDLHLYLDEMRDAMERWENFLQIFSQVRFVALLPDAPNHYTPHCPLGKRASY